MSSDYRALKKRYTDAIIRLIDANPQAYLDLDSPSERHGRFARPKPNRAARHGSRFGPRAGSSETERAFGAGIYDGFTFGAGDEIDAALAAIPAWLDDRDAGDTYDEELNRIRAETGYLQQQHPGAYLSGEILGSVAQPANLMGAGWAARGAGLTGRIGRAALAGAGNGAVHGFMAGASGADKRINEAGRGAIKGAFVGAALGAPLHGFVTGREIRFGPDFRIAPFGNRTNHPLGELPHYHRRGPTGPDGRSMAGQGIGRHRPWEKKFDEDGNPLDRSFWDRF